MLGYSAKVQRDHRGCIMYWPVTGVISYTPTFPPITFLNMFIIIYMDIESIWLFFCLSLLLLWTLILLTFTKHIIHHHIAHGKYISLILEPESTASSSKRGKLCLNLSHVHTRTHRGHEGWVLIAYHFQSLHSELVSRGEGGGCAPGNKRGR